ncbi:MAG: hypothetical protein WC450_10910 [Candidatus Omnitrophota bacterium]|jgi:hypothetical protein
MDVNVINNRYHSRIKPKPEAPDILSTLKGLSIAVTIIATVIFILAIGKAGAEPVYPAQLWKGILAEASNQGYAGMYSDRALWSTQVGAWHG